ncbi:peptide-methionine (S)-S-oxide reductase MsrA [Dyella tabacisoli]|uniref:Peptide methionine sulfoxide reductase MsrA n=1 Tax=Dyella tabacisoli TaxID=2282381 RepID=A0A369UUT6_9GAMM|nr:peptide-methionine (S)-S-oxide reductase MsrA [Dyella tabacisoli]RDD83370.1 peptide-methionine (S)-S-oxide reductase [Dyella tabacisoli]
MSRRTLFSLSSLTVTLALAVLSACSAPAIGRDVVALPDPKVDAAAPASHTDQVAVLAGGCFWGVDAVFKHVKGVKQVWSGYAGGNAGTATYSQVSDGDTGHAESVKILYDPAQISYGQLLRVFFSVATDPTQLNRQGPDTGTQYRSAIFYGSDEQQRIATAYIAQLTAAKAFDAPIVTQVVPLKGFYTAEAYHQDYFRLNPNNPYIIINDAPKVAHLKQVFPELYRSAETVVSVQLH